MPSAATSTTASSPSNPFRRRFFSCVSALTADWVYMEGGGPKLTLGSFFCEVVTEAPLLCRAA